MTYKLAYLAAAATLTFAGAALAQTPPSPGSAAQTQTTPGAVTTPSMTGMTSPPAPPASAEGAATPSSATVAGEVPVGAEVKDPAGLTLGVIDSVSTGPDGAANVVVSSGGKKFALPKASLTISGGAVSTTATKAQIDAALGVAR